MSTPSSESYPANSLPHQQLVINRNAEDSLQDIRLLREDVHADVVDDGENQRSIGDDDSMPSSPDTLLAHGGNGDSMPSSPATLLLDTIETPDNNDFTPSSPDTLLPDTIQTPETASRAISTLHKLISVALRQLDDDRDTLNAVLADLQTNIATRDVFRREDILYISETLECDVKVHQYVVKWITTQWHNVANNKPVRLPRDEDSEDTAVVDDGGAVAP